MTIIRYYIIIPNNEYILDKSFVPHQFDLVSIVKFEDTFPGLRSDEFLNSLYVTLWTLEICFSLSWIFGLINFSS